MNAFILKPACPFDIVFLVETRLYLAVQPEIYVTTSVKKAGPGWVQRFWDLHRAHHDRDQVRILSQIARAPKENTPEGLPAWLRYLAAKQPLDAFQRTS